jgi:dihydrofolate reductase
MHTIIIVAMTPEGLIGKAGGLPWHIPADLKHFKRTTEGHAVIMGRMTYDSVGKPLPRRRNIVITRNTHTIQPVTADDSQGNLRTSLDAVASLEKGLALCHSRDEEKTFIAGGSQIFKMALDVVDEMIVTCVRQPALTGDTFFPAWNPTDWNATPLPNPDGLDIVHYRRR